MKIVGVGIESEFGLGGALWVEGARVWVGSEVVDVGVVAHDWHPVHEHNHTLV